MPDGILNDLLYDSVKMDGFVFRDGRNPNGLELHIQLPRRDIGVNEFLYGKHGSFAYECDRHKVF